MNDQRGIPADDEAEAIAMVDAPPAAVGGYLARRGNLADQICATPARHRPACG